MSAAPSDLQTPRLRAASAELQVLIRQAYPTATFTVIPGEDPDGLYVWTTVDVEDTDAVVEVYIDRLLTLQIEEELPIYVVPIRPRASRIPYAPASVSAPFPATT
jgi:hypothetical protein